MRLMPSLPSSRTVFTNVGTNAADNAPSANTLRNELGILNAVKNASDKHLHPKI